MKDKEMLKVHSILFLGVIGISFSAIIIRNISAPPTIIAMYRLLITTLLFMPFTLTRRIQELKKATLRDYFLCCLSGLFLALHFITWITSLFHTSVAASTVLVSMQPIFTALVAFILFRERIGKRALVGMMIAIIGSSIIGLEGFGNEDGSFYGNMLALIGGLMGALYVTIGRGMRQKMSNLTYGFLVYGSCSIVLILVNIFTKTPFGGYSTIDYIYFAALAIICTVGGHTVLNWGLKYVEASKISTFMLGEPVGATFLAIIILKELPGILQIIGGVLILLGLYIFTGMSERLKGKRAATTN
ncbi:DMT family transporter [Alkaliphilus serpentinus]|uniref:DMT family transporter n=1 Tax=Alkaliphilus serpentinus TaxID=1482731 RepID=A0A833HR97_9FIRM|nr:DMT family transporter [Alkaliphilus serpentinus]KAB3533094.1 DMT family transporter [Alkaliphilus serpentinus]